MLHPFLATVSTADVHQAATVVIGVVWVLLIPLSMAAVRFYRSRGRGSTTTVSTDNSVHPVYNNLVFFVVRRDGPREERVYDPASTELVGIDDGDVGIVAAYLTAKN